jgi:urease accessory protein UreH
VVGGAEEGCEIIAVTSQTAERVYRALSKPARVMTKLKVSDGVMLAWFPQETIIFSWARLHRETEVEISSERAADTSSHLKRNLRDLIDQLGPEFGSGPFRVPKMWSY